MGSKWEDVANCPNKHTIHLFLSNTPDYKLEYSWPTNWYVEPPQKILIVIWLQFQQPLVNMIITFLFLLMNK